jgi:hypothetical protein
MVYIHYYLTQFYLSLDIYIFCLYCIYLFFSQNNNKKISKQQESQLTIIPFTQPFFIFYVPP